MAFYKETAQEEGFKYPEYLDEEYELSCQIDMPSLLKYYVDAGLFSLAGVAKMPCLHRRPNRCFLLQEAGAGEGRY